MSAQILPITSPIGLLPLWPISVAQYHEMIQHGIVADDSPVELLEGYLVQKMSKNPPHSAATGMLKDMLESLLPEGWILRVQEPITTFDSEPEPDLAVVKGRQQDFFTRHPLPAETAVVVEVADTTLQRDRGIKKRLYARAGLATYWIVNLLDNQLEVYQDPDAASTEPDYRQRRDYRGGEEVAVIHQGTELSRLKVSDFLPPSRPPNHEATRP